MKKILSLLMILGIFFSIISPTIAITAPQAKDIPSPIMQSSVEIRYPVGEDFVKLKSLIDANFIKSNGSYGYNCISNNKVCPSYKYTSIIEKAIKLIVLKTYIGNEEFYNSLFNNSNEMNYSSQNGSGIKYLLDRIPHGSLVLDSRSLGFGQSIGGELLEASFGVNFTESNNSSSMLGAIEQKIKDLKRTKCQKESGSNNCYSNDLSNRYLPTQEELYKESIYLNRSSVRIGDLSDEIEYTITFSLPIEQLPNSSITNDESEELSNTATGRYEGYMGSMMFMKTEGITQQDALGNCMRNVGANSGKGVRCMWNDKQIYPLVVREIGASSENISVPQSYTLRYKKDTYTLEEAKAVIEKKEVSTSNFIVTSAIENRTLPCEAAPSSQCSSAKVGLSNVQAALVAYLTNNAVYPDTLDKIKGTYSKPFPQDFDDNFSYRSTKNINGISDYEIKYIGHIGEKVAESNLKKDYRAMMSGAVVPEIPIIFAHIPADSMVLYIKNPVNLIDILNEKSNTSQRLSGIDVSESIRTFMKTFIELEKFDQIEKNLKHEMAIVVNNMDATAPDIVIILSESDKAALSPTAQARVVGSRDGYIFIASSKESLERFTSLTIENSLKNAPDFQYVWWKKSTLVKDAMIFVGDAFFEKMLTLETYLTHYRKYRDYARLSSLQELVWAYGDAFGKSPTAFDTFITAGFSSLTGEVLGEYSIVDGLVTHRNIGTMKSIKTLPESRYDLSKVSKTEIEDYKYNVLKYRETWRASLDPMGIVINRYGDGMELDFFMTPIPSSTDRELQQIQKMFEGTTKDTLSFITNSHIRMGLLSFVVGFDPKKLETKMKDVEEIGSDFQSFNKEILDGKNIFDYLGGEFAWSLGGLDPDIFEGWNVEKVDAYVSIQVASEAKGKELIDAFKSKMLDQKNNKASSSESAMINMLAKPLIEDYKGKKIYYVEAIPVPWVGKIGIAYTFVDDFFIIGINRPTIRHVIDMAVSGDIRKKNIISPDSLSRGTFFGALFDGESASQQIKKLYEKNQSVLPRYIWSMIHTQSNVTPLISSYYASQDRNERLGKKGEEFHYTLGSLSFSGVGDNIVAKIDQSKLSSLSGASLETWETIKNGEALSQAIFTEKGVLLEELLSQRNISDILSLNLQVQLSNAIDSSESLFRNVTFGMNMGDDEIGFRLQIFREKEGGKTFALSGSPDIWIILGLIIFLGVIGIGIVFIMRHKNAIIPAQQVDNTVKDATVEDSPAIVSTLIIPQQTNVIPAISETTPQVISITSESIIDSPTNLVEPVPTVVEPVPVDTNKPDSSEGPEVVTDTK